VQESLKDQFRPEFLNRLDEIVVFDVLTPEAITEIVKIRIDAVRTRLATKNISIEVTDEALAYLGREGYNPNFGARPLNRLIQTKILNPVASHIISNGVTKGDVVYVSMKNGELAIDTKKQKTKSSIKTRQASRLMN